MSFINNFSTFFKEFKEKEADSTKILNIDEETRFLENIDGVRELCFPPIKDITFCSKIPTKFGDCEKDKHIWVLLNNGFPFILEFCPCMKETNRGKASHTNLTGGAKAYCGGELWFESESKIYLNGGSGRYPPESEAQLNMIADILQETGYVVVNFGWDEDTDRPARFYRGSVA